MVYFPPSVCHHSSILLPAHTMTLFFQSAGKCSDYQPWNQRLCQKAERLEGLEALSVKVTGGVMQEKQVRYKNGALMTTIGQQFLGNKISRLEKKSPGLRSFQLSPLWCWPLAHELLWVQRFPATSVERPPLASGPFLHPGSSGSLWSTDWGGWARNWHPRPVDTDGGGFKTHFEGNCKHKFLDCLS